MVTRGNTRYTRWRFEGGFALCTLGIGFMGMYILAQDIGHVALGI